MVIPPWPGISDDALQALAVKVDKAKDTYRISELIRKVYGDDWSSQNGLAWHLVACRAIHPEKNPAILEFLDDAPEGAPPEVIMDMLVRLPDGSSKRYFNQSSMLMDGYSLTIDKLLFRTYRRAPEAARARENELNKSLRLKEDYQYSRAVGILAVHFDADILRAALEKDIGKNYIGAETLGGLGEVALPLLAWAYDQSEGDGLRRMGLGRAVLDSG